MFLGSVCWDRGHQRPAVRKCVADQGQISLVRPQEGSGARGKTLVGRRLLCDGLDLPAKGSSNLGIGYTGMQHEPLVQAIERLLAGRQQDLPLIRPLLLLRFDVTLASVNHIGQDIEFAHQRCAGPP